MKKIARTVVLSLVLVLPISAMTGCKSKCIPEAGARQLKDNLILLRKDYKPYLDSDPKFDDNPDGKKDRLGLIDDSVKLINESLK